MAYESLYKLYYKDTAAWEKIYQERFSSPAACLLPFSLVQYNHSHSWPAFFCYDGELALLQEKYCLMQGSASKPSNRCRKLQCLSFSILVWWMKSSPPMILRVYAAPGKKSLRLFLHRSQKKGCFGWAVLSTSISKLSKRKRSRWKQARISGFV